MFIGNRLYFTGKNFKKMQTSSILKPECDGMVAPFFSFFPVDKPFGWMEINNFSPSSHGQTFQVEGNKEFFSSSHGQTFQIEGNKQTILIFKRNKSMKI